MKGGLFLHLRALYDTKEAKISSTASQKWREQ